MYAARALAGKAGGGSNRSPNENVYSGHPHDAVPDGVEGPGIRRFTAGAGVVWCRRDVLENQSLTSLVNWDLLALPDLDWFGRSSAEGTGGGGIFRELTRHEALPFAYPLHFNSDGVDGLL